MDVEIADSVVDELKSVRQNHHLYFSVSAVGTYCCRVLVEQHGGQYRRWKLFEDVGDVLMFCCGSNRHSTATYFSASDVGACDRAWPSFLPCS